MRKILKLLSLVVIIACVFALGITGTLSASALTDDVVIYVPQDGTDIEKYAAESLSGYLTQVVGYDVDVVEFAQIGDVTTSNPILVGDHEDWPADISEVLTNGYVIQTKDYNGGKAVCIDGKNGGTLYATYRLLQEYCGCRWYSSDLTVIGDSYSIPTDADILYNPYFEYTETDWVSPHDIEFSLANGLNGGNYRSLTDEQGGTVNYIAGLCHTLSTTFCSRGTYFDSHPEYFAYRDGKRQPNQLCLTNPDVVDIVCQEVYDILNSSAYNPNVPLQIISITQDDNRDYCTCDNCVAYEKAHGDVRSATMINFVNQIAQYVKDLGSQYDNVAIDTFAYQYTRQAPTGIVPLDNVIVRLCTIECCFAHALDDDDCENNVELMKDLNDWSQICNRIYVWDYVTNYAKTLGYFPDFGVLQDNVQTFYEHNVLGIYEEGNYYMSACNTEFGDLRSYLLAKLLQNPYCDYYGEMDGFLEAYYGDGWQNIREFIDVTSENANEKGPHLVLYADMADTLNLTEEQIEYCNLLWENAKAECNDQTQLARVKRSEICWRVWKCGNMCSEFKGLFSSTRVENTQKLYDDIIALGTSMVCEGCGLDKIVNNFKYLPFDRWFGGGLGESAFEQIKTFIVGLCMSIVGAEFAEIDFGDMFSIDDVKNALGISIDLKTAFINTILATSIVTIGVILA